MRVCRRTSGGRGEYEISEPASNGLTPRDLFSRRIYIEFAPGWTIDTSVRLMLQGGKRRLRMMNAQMQLHRQIATGLLMSRSVRADSPLGRGAPILQSDRYAIEYIAVADVALLGDDGAMLRIGDLTLRNLSYHAEQLNVAERITKLQHLWR